MSDVRWFSAQVCAGLLAVEGTRHALSDHTCITLSWIGSRLEASCGCRQKLVGRALKFTALGSFTESLEIQSRRFG